MDVTATRATIADEIRVLMTRRRMSGVKLAAHLGKSDMWVSRRLRGEVAFDTDDLARIADLLGVTIADLLPRDVQAIRRYPDPVASRPTPVAPIARTRPADRRPPGHPRQPAVPHEPGRTRLTRTRPA